MMLAPGHFHAALVLKQATAGVHPRVHVYAPLDEDTLLFLDKVRQFNSRPADPTRWDLQLCAGDNFLARFLQQTPGNALVLSGRNSAKIDFMQKAAEQNLDILADKPWIVDAKDFPKLQEFFAATELRDVVAWDMMTERFEPLTKIQRELMRDPDIFGSPLVGTRDYPTLSLESIHYIKKTVAGETLKRPIWWFNPTVAGTALTDVGSHLADLAMWLLFPEKAIDYQKDITIHNATAWPTMLEEYQFETITGGKAYPPELQPYVQDRTLHYAGNGSVDYTLCGAHVRITTIWEYESVDGPGDLHEATALGSKCRIAVRNSSSQHQLVVVPTKPSFRQALFTALSRRSQNWQLLYPGLSVHDLGEEFEVRIPTTLLGNHESHFASVLREFMTYFHNSRRMPAWEQPNLLAKYWLTTQADLISRQS
jgi:predicted dehydrogenase